jgi:hypothetical protein
MPGQTDPILPNDCPHHHLPITEPKFGLGWPWCYSTCLAGGQSWFCPQHGKKEVRTTNFPGDVMALGDTIPKNPSDVLIARRSGPDDQVRAS